VNFVSDTSPSGTITPKANTAESVAGAKARVAALPTVNVTVGGAETSSGFDKL
jgi:hypothetical protein